MNEEKFHLGIKAVIINSEKQLLLLKVNLKNLDGYNGNAYWDLPGGRLAEGDTIESAIKREIKEEINQDNFQNLKLLSACVSNIEIPVDNHRFRLIAFFYFVDLVFSNEIVLSYEHTQYKWFSIKKAIQLLSTKYPNTELQFLNNLS